MCCLLIFRCLVTKAETGRSCVLWHEFPGIPTATLLGRRRQAVVLAPRLSITCHRHDKKGGELCLFVAASIEEYDLNMQQSILWEDFKSTNNKHHTTHEVHGDGQRIVRCIFQKYGVRRMCAMSESHSLPSRPSRQGADDVPARVFKGKVQPCARLLPIHQGGGVVRAEHKG